MACPRLSSCSRWRVLPSKYTPKGMLLSPSSAPCQPPTCLLGLCQWPLEFSAFALDLSYSLFSTWQPESFKNTDQILSLSCSRPSSAFWPQNRSWSSCQWLLGPRDRVHPSAPTASRPPSPLLTLLPLCSLCFFMHDLSTSHLLPLLSRFTGITHSLSKLPLSS